jgi:hypothetical protein
VSRDVVWYRTQSLSSLIKVCASRRIPESSWSCGDRRVLGWCVIKGSYLKLEVLCTFDGSVDNCCMLCTGDRAGYVGMNWSPICMCVNE